LLPPRSSTCSRSPFFARWASSIARARAGYRTRIASLLSGRAPGT
jgi:hypothetical protein